MKLHIVAAAAVAGLLSAGCSSDTGTAAPSATNSSPAATVSPTLSSLPSARPDVLKADDLGSLTDVVWREDLNYDEKTSTNEEVTLAAGAYQLQAVCTAGRVKITANRGQSLQVACSGALAPGLNICTTKPGLLASIERLPGPLGDLVWQLKKVSPERCAK